LIGWQEGERRRIKHSEELPAVTPPEVPLRQPVGSQSSRGQHPKKALIAVDARSLRVFRQPFFNPGVTSSPGEIPWHDFVHAMTSTGLFSAEKLYGSVWQFQRLDAEGQSPIRRGGMGDG